MRKSPLYNTTHWEGFSYKYQGMDDKITSIQPSSNNPTHRKLSNLTKSALGFPIIFKILILLNFPTT
jgi:hypothetical protein